MWEGWRYTFCIQCVVSLSFLLFLSVGRNCSVENESTVFVTTRAECGALTVTFAFQIRIRIPFSKFKKCLLKNNVVVQLLVVSSQLFFVVWIVVVILMEMSLPNGVDVSQLVQHPVLAALPPFFLRASERYQVDILLIFMFIKRVMVLLRR